MEPIFASLRWNRIANTLQSSRRGTSVGHSERVGSVPKAQRVIVQLRTTLWALLPLILLNLVFPCLPGLMGQSTNRNQVPPSPNPPKLRDCPYSFVQASSDGAMTIKGTATGRCFDESLGNGVSLTLVEVPAGEFVMGSPVSEPGRQDNEGPEHAVRVPRFFLGVFEVTEEQYEAIARSTKIRGAMELPLEAGFDKERPTAAADGLSWNDAVEFCARLRALTGRPYRLPSEAEWEYAARAGSQTAHYYGSIFKPDLVNNRRFLVGPDKNFSGLFGAVEGGKAGPANLYGLYDMEGNVEEWVNDRYHPNYIGAPVDGSAWVDQGSEARREAKGERVSRGGSSGTRPELVRSAARAHWDPRLRASGFGFRVALSIPN